MTIITNIYLTAALVLPLCRGPPKATVHFARRKRRCLERSLARSPHAMGPSYTQNPSLGSVLASIGVIVLELLRPAQYFFTFSGRALTPALVRGACVCARVWYQSDQSVRIFLALYPATQHWTNMGGKRWGFKETHTHSHTFCSTQRLQSDKAQWGLHAGVVGRPYASGR